MNERQEGMTPDTSSTTAADGRMFERHRFATGRVCHFVVWPSCRGGRAELHDISVNGIAILLTEPLEAGRDIVIRIPPTGNSRGHSLSGQVAHVMPLSDGRWRIGCALCRTLSEAEIDAML